MKIPKSYFILFIIFMSMSKLTFAQIFIDGDSTDWNGYPTLIEAPDNLQGIFPVDVGAAVTDYVDLKTIKATVIDNVLFAYFEFWSGPAWPNNAYHNNHNGVIYYESRGYYNLLLDFDNNKDTGWGTDWYEAHPTIPGYLISQGTASETIGAEVMLGWYCRTNDDWKVANEKAKSVRNLEYRAGDVSGYNGVNDLGQFLEIFNMPVQDADSLRMMQWQDSLKITRSEDEDLLSDSLTSYWVSHAWGSNFLEFGLELTAVQKYFSNKIDQNILQPGDTIGICGMIETPIDDWGIDMSSRGSLIISEAVGINENTFAAYIEQFKLYQNYPNPFNPTTTISYQLPQHSTVELAIYSTTGQKIKTLVSQQQAVGSYQVEWNAGDLASGVYFYKLTAGDFIQMKKLLLLK